MSLVRPLAVAIALGALVTTSFPVAADPGTITKYELPDGTIVNSDTPSTLPSHDQASTMTDIKGPAVDTEAFRAEGHCCGIRLPVLNTLTESGIPLELTPEARARLIAEGVLPDESEPAAEAAPATSCVSSS